MNGTAFGRIRARVGAIALVVAAATLSGGQQGAGLPLKGASVNSQPPTPNSQGVTIPPQLSRLEVGSWKLGVVSAAIQGPAVKPPSTPAPVLSSSAEARAPVEPGCRDASSQALQGRKDQASAHTLTSDDRSYAHLLSFSHPRPPPDRMAEIPAEPRLQEPSDKVSRNACSHRSFPCPGHPRS